MTPAIEIGQFWRKKTNPKKIIEIIEVEKKGYAETVVKVRNWYRVDTGTYSMINIEPEYLTVPRFEYKTWVLIDVEY